ncbi:MAG: type II secretion system F family protein [Bacillaceae bacterium]|nr:type II secretion system F family protein [Bacillaceae bacterium]
MEVILLILAGLTIFFFIYSLLSWRFVNKAEVNRRLKHLVDELDDEQKEKLKEKRRKQILEFNQAARRMGTRFTTKEKLQVLQNQLTAAGLQLHAEEYIVFRIIFTLLLFFLTNLITGSIFMGIIGLFAGWMLPKIWIKRRIDQRLQRFNEQLPEALNTMVSSLRAGFSFPQALQTAADEMDDPISTELDTVIREMQWGRTLEEALNNLKVRVPSYDLELLIEAVVVQRQVGGNLATIISTIVNTIRERNRIQRQIRTLTAQGRLSGYVVGFLPFGLGIVIYLMDENYILTLFRNPLGIALVVVGVISSLLGFLMIKKIVTIEV